MNVNATSGDMVWEGMDRYNSLQPVAIVAYSPASGGYVPLKTTDFSSSVSISGGLSIGNVTISGSTANTSSNFTVASGDGTVLAASQTRALYHAQNIGTGILYVKEGAGASPTSWSYILAGSSSPYDGLGGFMSDETWKGAVSVANPPGTSGLYLFTSLS